MEGAEFDISMSFWFFESNILSGLEWILFLLSDDNFDFLSSKYLLRYSLYLIRFCFFLRNLCLI